MAKYESLCQREFVNPETGEVTTIETAKSFTRKIKEDNFYMVFFDFIGSMYGLKPDKVRDLLMWMCVHAEYNTGIVRLTTEDRKEVQKQLSVSNNQITNYLKKLKDLKLISGKNGVFTINPQVFWKGELKARRALLADSQVRITFSIEDNIQE